MKKSLYTIGGKDLIILRNEYLSEKSAFMIIQSYIEVRSTRFN